MPDQIFSLRDDEASIGGKLLMVDAVPAEWEPERFEDEFAQFLNAFDRAAKGGVTREDISRIVMPLGRFPNWARQAIIDALDHIGDEDFVARGDVGLDDVDWDDDGDSDDGDRGDDNEE